MPSVGGASVSATAGAVEVWSINDSVGWDSVGAGSGVDCTDVDSDAKVVSCSPRDSAVIASCVNVRLMPSVGGASVSVSASAVDVWSISDSVGWASVGLVPMWMGSQSIQPSKLSVVARAYRRSLLAESM